MKRVFSEEHRFTAIVAAEVALAQAEAACGMIPQKDADIIAEKAKSASLERSKEIEDEIHHDMMAVVRAVSEVCGPEGRWVHYGATSNDILDTATGLQIRDALDILEHKLKGLLKILLDRAEKTRYLVCIGRTHGQHGVPTKIGRAHV